MNDTYILKSKNDTIYKTYIVCSKQGIKKHICYKYIDAITYINNYKGGHVGNIYRDSKGMYIIGVPYNYKCKADYNIIYSHK